MPEYITKYKLHPAFDNENEFEVTRITIVETRKTQRVDDEGFAFSGRQKPTTEVTKRYGIIAKSFPSGKPARVEILESKELNDTQILMEEAAVNKTEFNETSPSTQEEPARPKPIRTNHLLDNSSGRSGRPAAVDLTAALNNERKSVSIPKAGEITWADGSDSSSGDAGPQPF